MDKIIEDDEVKRKAEEKRIKNLQYMKEYREKNKEEIKRKHREQMRKYREEHPDYRKKESQYFANKYKTDPEFRKKMNENSKINVKKLYQIPENKEKIKAYQKKRYHEQKEIKRREKEQLLLTTLKEEIISS